MDVWKKLLGKYICFEPVAPCLPTALKVVVCLLLYYFSPGTLNRSLAFHVTEPGVQTHHHGCH